MNWASRWESEKEDRESRYPNILKIKEKPYILFICQNGQLAFFEMPVVQETKIEKPRLRLKEIAYERELYAEEMWLKKRMLEAE